MLSRASGAYRCDETLCVQRQGEHVEGPELEETELQLQTRLLDNMNVQVDETEQFFRKLAAVSMWTKYRGSVHVIYGTL